MLLSVENISLNFGKRKILDKVSLNVDEGCIIAITGKSGGGKTSLLGIISGLLEPDAGKVFYKKKNILKWGDLRRSRFRNREIGFVFQFFNLLPDMTSYQNIRYPTLIKLFPGNVDREIREMAKFLNIEQVLNQKPVTLSGGERQRVAIARAIINHPRLILADEPTGNLDVVTAAEIKNLFLNLKNRERMAIILVTHDQTLIEIADEHYHLEDGKLEKVTVKSSVQKKETATKPAKRTTAKNSDAKNKTAGTKKAEKGVGKKSAVKAKIKK